MERLVSAGLLAEKGVTFPNLKAPKLTELASRRVYCYNEDLTACVTTLSFAKLKRLLDHEVFRCLRFFVHELVVYVDSEEMDEICRKISARELTMEEIRRTTVVQNKTTQAIIRTSEAIL
jgi:hypothetical protein